MEFLEKDLEEIIFKTGSDDLQERNLFITGKKIRQLRIGNYGISDIVTFSRTYDDEYLMYGNILPVLNITVYELKKDKIGISAFLQAVRYVKGIEQFLKKRVFKNKVSFKIVLVGRTIDLNSSFSFLESIIPSNYDGSNFLYLYTYQYDLEGLYFKEHNGYSLIDDGFKIDNILNPF